MVKRLLSLMLSLCLFPLHALMLSGPVYQVFPGSFKDGDGDNRGDLKGVLAALPYIQSLHVKGLWLTPIAPSPSYHRYDVTDYKAVDPALGAMEDFERLAAACREKGLALILDLVLNHTSREHPWFLQAVDSLKTGRDSPYRRYYLFSDDKTGHPVPGVPGMFYVGGFGSHMPDLNLDNEDVRREILDIVSFWLQKGAAGFRLDAVTYYYEGNTERNLAFLSWLNAQVKALSPDAFLVGEAWTDEYTINTLYQSGIDSLFDFPLHGADGLLVKALRSGQGDGLSKALEARYARLRKANPLARNAPFLGNHDTSRIAGALRMKAQRQKAAMALCLLLPGVPFVYYGDELGMTGSGRDENKRLPMLWRGDGESLCLAPEHADQQQRLNLGVSEQESDPASLLNHVRAVLAAREACPELAAGQYRYLPTGIDTVCAYAVECQGSVVTVAHNLGKEGAAIPLPPGSAVYLGDTGSGAPAAAGGTLLLPPFSTAVFR